MLFPDELHANLVAFRTLSGAPRATEDVFLFEESLDVELDLGVKGKQLVKLQKQALVGTDDLENEVKRSRVKLIQLYRS